MIEKKKSRTSTAVKTRYNSKVYDNIAVRVPKDMAEAFKAKCVAEGISQARVIKAAIERFLKKEEEMDEIIERAYNEAKERYIAEYGADKWEQLTRDEKFDIARGALEKYYDPEKRGYVLK